MAKDDSIRHSAHLLKAVRDTFCVKATFAKRLQTFSERAVSILFTSVDKADCNGNLSLQIGIATCDGTAQTPFALKVLTALRIIICWGQKNGTLGDKIL